MSDEFHTEFVGPSELNELKPLKEALQETVWQELKNHKSLQQQLHNFVEFSYEMLKVYEKDRHGLLDEYRQTQYEHIILLCLALQAFPETLNNRTIQQAIQQISEKIDISYPFDITECCHILDKIIDVDIALRSDYSLTLILLKLENPVSKKSGMKELATLLESLLHKLPQAHPAYVFIDVLNRYVNLQLGS